MKTKRCKSVSEGAFHKRCKKDRGHGEHELLVTHQNGPIVWHDYPANPLIKPMAEPHPLRVTFGGTDLTGMLKDVKLGQRATTVIQDETHQMPSDPRVAELAEWWRQTAENEIKQTVEKAIEYGSTDLIDIGQSLARVAGRKIDDSTAAEWGIFFYLEGKLSRWRSAIERGDIPSFDTLLDIGVYARMAQRVRMTGGWPGTEEQTYKQQVYGEGNQ